MHESGTEAESQALLHKATEVAIRLFVVGALAAWCFLLLEPFLMPLVTGVVAAVALAPLYFRVVSWVGGRRKLAGTLFILVGVSALVIPSFLLSESAFEGMRWLREQNRKEALQVPPPPASVAEWPLIGETVFEEWTQASVDLERALAPFAPQVRSVGAWLLRSVTGLGRGILILIVSIVVAGVVLIHAASGGEAARAIGRRFAGEKGAAFADLSAQTIRSVATGVIGVATIQAILAGIGLFLAGVPAAALWAVVVLVLAVAQLPPLLVLLPAILYVASVSDSTMTIVLFSVWSLVVSVSDSFLKPMLLGRGLDIPMPVILLGAIGGMIRSGIIGLFVGAVVLAIGYKVFTVWLDPSEG